MSHHNRKRTRTNNRPSNNSFTSLASQSSEGETAITPTASETQPVTLEIFHQRLDKIVDELLALHNAAIPFDLAPSNQHATGIAYSFITIGGLLYNVCQASPIVSKLENLVKLREFLHNTQCSDNRVDASVSTEPPLAPVTYNNVTCMADIAPTHSAPPLNPSPSPKPGPRPPCPPCPKKAQLLTPWPCPHQVRSNVRLVACIAGQADAVTSMTLHWKEVPTDCFSSLSKDFKAAAPGCTPLRFHCNQKGNLIITFTLTASCSLLMYNLNIICGNFELAFHVLILFDTPWSTLHLTHVPAHSQDRSPIFNQSALAESILANLALSMLPLTSPPTSVKTPWNLESSREKATTPEKPRILQR
ncbi:hypothetical protein FRC11_012048, partial [Ceratobasidium sp. 423]